MRVFIDFFVGQEKNKGFGFHIQKFAWILHLGRGQKGQATEYLPKILQSNNLEPTLTFQNNHGIFLVINLDIPNQC